MAEKLKDKPVEEPVKVKKKALVVATVLGDLLFVEKLPDKRQYPLLVSLKEKMVKEGKSSEVIALDTKLQVLQEKMVLEEKITLAEQVKVK